MGIDSLLLEKVAAFEYAELTFSAGINVFLGPNGTGKSIAMRAAYSLAHTAAADEASKLVHLTGSLHPEGSALNRVIRNRVEDGQATIAVRMGGEEVACRIRPEGTQVSGQVAAQQSTFIPTLEVLSIFRGLLPEIQSRDLDFDTTVADLCLALQRGVLIGEAAAKAEALVANLEPIIGGRIALANGRFLISTSFGDLEPHLLAEGLRRLGVLVQLVRNGSIAPGSVLFWDEPETNLNPRLIRLVADLLVELAKHGVQIFAATHDFLLSNRLSLRAEYEKLGVGLKFFSFSRRHLEDPVRVDPGGTLADLPENPIVEEFGRHYDFERELFMKENATS